MKIPFVYKRASAPFPDEMVCPVYEQAYKATCVFNRQWRFSPFAALDSFPPRAQNHSYTNEYPVSRHATFSMPVGHGIGQRGL